MKKNKNIEADLNGILEKYLTKEEIQEYLGTIAPDFLPQQSLRLVRPDSQLNIFFDESIQSKKVHLLSDTLITFATKKIHGEKYIEFLLEFSKLVLARGENNLSFEIADNIYNSLKSQKEYELYKAHALLLIAEYYMAQAMWKNAFNAIKSARTIYESLCVNNGIGKCEFLTGSIYVEQGDLKAGKVRLANCAAYIQPETDPLLSAQIDVHFGIINYVEGNLEAAMEYYEKSLIRFEQLNDVRRSVEVLLNKAMIYRKLNQVERALEIFNKCSDIARENGFLSVLKLCFLNKTEIYLDKNELELAAKFSQKTIELCYQLNDRLSIAEVHKLSGKIARMQNNQSLAENYLLTSLRLNNNLDQELNAAETHYELGMLYKEDGKKSEALNHLMNALKYFTRNNSRGISMEIESQMLALNN